MTRCFSLKAFRIIPAVLVLVVYMSDSSHSLNAQTNVCQIMGHPKNNVPRQIVVDADLYNIMPHGIYLGDQRCSKRLLQIDFYVENADVSVVELRNFISNSMKQGPLIASGRFMGVLMRDNSSKRLYLMVKSVKDLHAKGWTPEGSDNPPSLDVPDTLLHESGHVANPPKPQ